MNTTTNVVSLDDPTALDPTVAGAKAANLAAARAAGLPALPGVVLTTDWSFTEKAAAVTAWRFLSSNAATKVVVRSSSTGEDGGESSMAGVFESILDVADEAAFLEAVDLVIASAEAAKDAGLVDANMAVLVQPMLDARFGGVLFGADPTTGRTDRLLLAAVAGNPSALVSGEAEGWTAILDRKGKVRDVRSGGDTDRPPVAVVRQLAKLSRDVADTYGGPQDIEWAVDGAGTLHLLQARPITTLPPTTGPVYGPGPVAESFPEALSVLEQDLWLTPMRDGIREALRLSGIDALQGARKARAGDRHRRNGRRRPLGTRRRHACWWTSSASSILVRPPAACAPHGEWGGCAAPSPGWPPTSFIASMPT